MILFGRKKQVPTGGIGPLQNAMDEIKRLRYINQQQADGWQRAMQNLAQLDEALRDANAYIQVLEHECDMWRQKYDDLAAEEVKDNEQVPE